MKNFIVTAPKECREVGEIKKPIMETELSDVLGNIAQAEQFKQYEAEQKTLKTYQILSSNNYEVGETFEGEICYRDPDRMDSNDCMPYVRPVQEKEEKMKYFSESSYRSAFEQPSHPLTEHSNEAVKFAEWVVLKYIVQVGPGMDGYWWTDKKTIKSYTTEQLYNIYKTPDNEK